MKLSVAVMMHPEREQFRDYLLSKLGDVPVVMDRGEGLWDTCRRAWLAFDPTAEFHIVVQDDAIVCDDFHARAAERLTRALPHSFYFGNRRTMRDLAAKGLAEGSVTHTLHWSLCVALPTFMVQGMVDGCDSLTVGVQDDRMKRWLKANKLPVVYPIPCLVDHRAEKSLVTGNTSAVRHAYRFIGEGE